MAKKTENKLVQTLGDLSYYTYLCKKLKVWKFGKILK